MPYRMTARRTRTTADPPFDFAQGRLCGDDNQNGNDGSDSRGRGALGDVAVEAGGEEDSFVAAGGCR
jgi:hypothetical protein